MCHPPLRKAVTSIPNADPGREAEEPALPRPSGACGLHHWVGTRFFAPGRFRGGRDDRPAESGRAPASGRQPLNPVQIPRETGLVLPTITRPAGGITANRPATNPGVACHTVTDLSRPPRHGGRDAVRSKILFSPTIEVLLVEDNPSDVELIREALDQTSSVFKLHIAEDGEAALALLRKEPPHENAPTPQLILLDLELPTIGGFELLAALKADADWRRIPVVVFATSDENEDITRAYDERAAAYIKKPSDFAEFQRAVATIHRFWTEAATLPQVRTAM
jgi:chemotaxis family two-component system response regulator Rcp1